MHLATTFQDKSASHLELETLWKGSPGHRDSSSAPTINMCLLTCALCQRDCTVTRSDLRSRKTVVGYSLLTHWPHIGRRASERNKVNWVIHLHMTEFSPFILCTLVPRTGTTSWNIAAESGSYQRKIIIQIQVLPYRN